MAAEKGIGELLIGGVAAGLVLFGCSLIFPLVGAFAGWSLSIAMPNWISTGLGLLGIGAKPEQFASLGATLGFVGSFFRSSSSK